MRREIVTSVVSRFTVIKTGMCKSGEAKQYATKSRNLNLVICASPIWLASRGRGAKEVNSLLQLC